MKDNKESRADKFNRVDFKVKNSKSEIVIIECALSLGTTSGQSAKEAIRNAYSAALRPTINTMAATGIVALPGMMTGQILSRIISVRYQITILCAITGAVAVTSFLIVQQGYSRFFTDAHQLKRE